MKDGFFVEHFVGRKSCDLYHNGVFGDVEEACESFRLSPVPEGGGNSNMKMPGRVPCLQCRNMDVFIYSFKTYPY